MIKLRKFYELISRNAVITLATGEFVHYYGIVKNIPDEYDDWTVVDFIVTKFGGDFVFQISK